jgi:hypothetical protein
LALWIFYGQLGIMWINSLIVGVKQTRKIIELEKLLLVFAKI